MKNNLIKIILITFIIVFLGIYLSQMNSYYEYKEFKKSFITQNKIKEFEGDVKDNIFSNKKYVTKEKNYNNKASIFGIKISRFIEISFNKFMKKVVDDISGTINNNWQI